MGVFVSPHTGAKFCWISQEYFLGSQADADAKCKEIGFTGLAEARSPEERHYITGLNLCKYIKNIFSKKRFFENKNGFSKFQYLKFRYRTCKMDFRSKYY